MSPIQANDLMEQTKERARHVVSVLDSKFGTPTGSVDLLAMSKTLPADHLRLYINSSRLLRSLARLEKAKS